MGTVQRVDLGRDLGVLRVRRPGRTFFVIVSAVRGASGIGVTRSRPFRGGLPADAIPEGERLRVRRALEGGALVGVGDSGLSILREGKRFSLATGEGQVRFSIEEGQGEGEAGDAEALDASLEALEAEGARLAHAIAEARVGADRKALSRALAAALGRIGRRREAVLGDLSRIGEAEGTAARASLFVAAASRAPRGARELVVTDWSTGEPLEARLALDPAKGAQEQVDALFRRARRLKAGAAIARTRLAETEAREAILRRLQGELEALGEGGEAGEAGAAARERLAAIAARAKEAAPRDFSRPAPGAGGEKRGKAGPRLPFRAFVGAGGARILVGRSAKDSDALTLKVARPQDLWLHAKNRTGAHVIVPRDRRQGCPADLLVDAAHLAAHFSDAREEALVEIQTAERRHLRKPKGAAPGLVLVDREKVIALRIEPARLAALLGTEQI